VTPAAKSRWWLVLAVGAVMALVFARVLTWHRLASAPELALTPRGERLSNAGLIALPVIPVVVLMGLAVARRATKGLAIGFVVLALLGGGTSFGFLYKTFELFRPKLQQTFLSPDGTREAHVYEDNFLTCEVYVVVSERRAAVGRKEAQRAVACGDSLDAVWVGDVVELRDRSH